jgi:predicted AAA+ superfamily ATPase
MKSIPPEQVAARLRADNPWWQDDALLPGNYANLVPRPYLNLLYPLITDTKIRRAVVLLGPRRVGKTVMIHHAIRRLISDGVDPKTICYTAIDHPIYNGLSLDQLLNTFGSVTGVNSGTTQCYLFLDEIQYLRDWEMHVKALVDTHAPLKCIVSGSAAAALRLKSAESGAGRFTDFMLPPLTFHEYTVLLNKTDLVQIETAHKGFVRTLDSRDIEAFNNHFVTYLNYGGYPELALSEDIRADPGRFVKSDIIDKVLLRDLPSLYGIQDIQELNYLFTTLAFNTANEVSLDELSQGSGVSKTTIKKYIEYLEASFLIRTIHRVDRSAKRFQRANFFKVYLTNPSMRAALFSPVRQDDDAMGNLVETAIFSQWFHSQTALHYARWHNGEVDIVCLGPKHKALWAIEVKWSDRFFKNPEELRSLLRFSHTQNLTAAMVTTKTRKGTKAVESVSCDFIPSSLYCYMLGFNIVRGQHILEGLVEPSKEPDKQQSAAE